MVLADKFPLSLLCFLLKETPPKTLKLESQLACLLSRCHLMPPLNKISYNQPAQLWTGLKKSITRLKGWVNSVQAYRVRSQYDNQSNTIFLQITLSGWSLWCSVLVNYPTESLIELRSHSRGCNLWFRCFYCGVCCSYYFTPSPSVPLQCLYLTLHFVIMRMKILFPTAVSFPPEVWPTEVPVDGLFRRD